MVYGSERIFRKNISKKLIMAALSFTQENKIVGGVTFPLEQWVSDVIQPTEGNIEVRVHFKDKGGGFVGVERSADGVTFTPYESGAKGNLGENTEWVIFNVSGLVPNCYLRIRSTGEPDSDCSWI